MTRIQYSVFKKSATVLLAAAFLFLAGCAQPPDCARADVICAALVTDTLGIEDDGINQDTWIGLQNSKNAGVIHAAEYIESIDSRDYSKNIAYFAERGYDIIITSGISLRRETLRAADEYKHVQFIGINQTYQEKKDNLISIAFPEDQIGFLAGVLAARTTRTGMIGAVCETSDIDSMWRYCEGFRKGARSVDKKSGLVILFNDNVDSEKLFVDEEWGRKTAQTEIQRGVDVIFAAGGITAQGAIQSALQAGIKVIGAERNQSAALKESNTQIIASIYGDAQAEVEDILRALAAGGEVNPRAQGRIKMAALSPTIPEPVLNELADLLTQLRGQKIRTGVPAIKP